MLESCPKQPYLGSLWRHRIELHGPPTQPAVVRLHERTCCGTWIPDRSKKPRKSSVSCMDCVVRVNPGQLQMNSLVVDTTWCPTFSVTTRQPTVNWVLDTGRRQSRCPGRQGDLPVRHSEAAVRVARRGVRPLHRQPRQPAVSGVRPGGGGFGIVGIDGGAERERGGEEVTW